MRRLFKNLFFKIISDETLRKKLYTNNETKKSFKTALKYSLKYSKSYLEKILFYPDLLAKLKHLLFIPEELIEKAFCEYILFKLKNKKSKKRALHPSTSSG